MLNHKVVIITGATSGIGRSLAFALAGEGARLMLAARRVIPLSEVAGEIQQRGGHASFLAADLTREDDVRHLIWRTREEFGRIDVLVNNAGVGYFGPVDGMRLSDADDVMRLNFWAPLIAMQAVIPVMTAQKCGHIINVSSIVGRRGLPFSGIYCASKSALGGISESVRLEVRKSGIHVSLIYPGATETAFFESVRKGSGYGNLQPLGKRLSPDAVAASIVDCIRRPRVEVYPYGPGRLVAWAGALAPALLDRLVERWTRDRANATTPERDPQ